MGHDSARYADQAIKTLGMDRLITSGVIISKLGYGVSSLRGTVETVYLALVRFVDERPYAAGKLAKLRTLAMTLRAEKVLDGSSNVDRQAIEIDARVCAEVTEILRRLLAEEFS
jgi:Arc/MetJ family transcription regulator